MITSIAEATENLAAEGWKLTVEYEKGWRRWRATASRPSGSIATSGKTKDAAVELLAALWTDSVGEIAKTLTDFRVATFVNADRQIAASVSVGREFASDVPIDRVSGCLLGLRDRSNSSQR